jgi:hypothetical protein
MPQYRPNQTNEITSSCDAKVGFLFLPLTDRQKPACSRPYFTLIVTGTPGGVGLFSNPPRLLIAGDVVEVEITGLGILRNVVEQEGR